MSTSAPPSLSGGNHISETRNERICQRCQKIFQEPRVLVRASFGEIRNAAAHGCFICKHLVNENEDRETGGCRIGTPDYVQLYCGGSAYEPHVVFRADNERILRYLRVRHPRSRKEQSITRSLFPERVPLFVADPATLSDNTGSDASLTLSQEWLSSCLRHHKVCSIDHEGWNPTRLLRIEGSGSRVRLCLGTTLSDEPYATLSHCWGKDSILSLTSNTAESLFNSIPVENLPLTYREAVHVTHKLGIYYIWIDSLCIVQDSIEDWNKESGQMSKVYSNGRINISASDTQNSTSGLFRQRDAGAVTPCSIPDPCLLGESSTASPAMPSAYLGVPQQRILHREYDFHDDVNHSRLSIRGWVFQERLLSRRILHFTRKQLYWECCRCTASETLPASIYTLCTSSLDMPPHKIPFHVKPNETFDNHEIEAPKEFIDSELWRNFVDAYARTNLTISKDRLVALAGIASVFAAFMDDHYYAGLWGRTLLQCLMWWVWTPEPVSRGADYIAPTWSWASINGQTSYLKDIHRIREQATVLEVQAIPLTTDVFGTVREAHITISGALRLLQYRGRRDMNGYSSDSSLFSSPDDPTMRVEGEAFMDVSSISTLESHAASPVAGQSLGENDEFDSLWTLPLYHSGYSTESVTLYGLILQPSGNRSGEFVRIGVFRTRSFPREALATVFEREEKRLESQYYEAIDAPGIYVIRLV